MILDRNSASESINQKLVFVGSEEGKLLALRQTFEEVSPSYAVWSYSNFLLLVFFFLNACKIIILVLTIKGEVMKS